MLDSVDKCVITSNIDTGSPASGSWMTKGTFGPGSYIFDDNSWHTQPPALFHALSKYRFGNDTGIVGRNAGRAVVPSSSNVMTISHGCFATPKVIITPEGNVGNFNTLSINASNFQVSWGVAGTPNWHWHAEV
jgi:hypothetical protein